MVERVQIGERIKGSLMQNEDWWYLVLEDDGTCHVEHQWSYVDPYGKAKPNSGKKNYSVENYSVEEFLAGDHGEGLKSELRSALAKSGKK